tara:strand:- start:2339 stop:2899 length:561 start_codon:yes stop_codon:yes gene_type:complete
MIRIEKEEIAEMEAMLKHLYFTTNKTKPVELGMKSFVSAYDVKYKSNIGSILIKLGIIKKHGITGAVSYSWGTSEIPSKKMARRVIECNALSATKYNKGYKRPTKAISIKESTEKISREEFEKRLEMVNIETGEFSEELKKVKKMNSKPEAKAPEASISCKEISSPSNKRSTEVKILWGLFSYSKK